MRSKRRTSFHLGSGVALDQASRAPLQCDGAELPLFKSVADALENHPKRLGTRAA